MLHTIGSVPADWTLVFTGHSLGGALALLTTTMAELQQWHRRPDATVTFGAPRIADEVLDNWWRSNGLCGKLLRVNVWNDAVHWTPFLTTWSKTDIFKAFMFCATSLKRCVKRGPMRPSVKISDRWTHVCRNESELVIPGAARGINPEMDDFSPMGGVMSHLLGHCDFGCNEGYDACNYELRMYKTRRLE